MIIAAAEDDAEKRHVEEMFSILFGNIPFIQAGADLGPGHPVFFSSATAEELAEIGRKEPATVHTIETSDNQDFVS